MKNKGEAGGVTCGSATAVAQTLALLAQCLVGCSYFCCMKNMHCSTVLTRSVGRLPARGCQSWLHSFLAVTDDQSW